MPGWLDRHWRVISAYAVLGVVAFAIGRHMDDGQPVIWTGHYTFSADDQDAIDAAEFRIGSNVTRAAKNRHQDRLELVSELRVAPLEIQR